MFSYLYTTFIYEPLYNGLIGLVDILPGAIDAGIAVILFTIIVKLILSPLSKKAILYQIKMKRVQPKLTALQAEFKHDKQLQAVKTMEFYKKEGISPFSSILPILIQLPIIIALYRVFTRSGLPVVNQAILYSFVHVPTINIMFLGIVDITKPNLIIALCAAVSQYFYFKISMPVPETKPKKFGDAPNFQEDLSRSMSVQMKYIFPIIIFFMAYKFSAVVAIYWTVNNLFTLVQDYVIKKKFKEKELALANKA